MARRTPNKFLRSLVAERVSKRWAKAARGAKEADLSVLRRERNYARTLRQHLNELIYVADSRLALPMIGSTTFRKPQGSDWAWRPQLWRGPLPVPGMSSVQNKSQLGDEVTLFHDCVFSELTLRQLRNTREADLAPFGMRMDVFKFDGSFLSLVIDLPPEAVQGLKRRHLLRMDTIVEMEKPLEIFARLNIRHGPNTEQIVRELPLHEEEIMVEFDLAYTKLNEKRVEKAWLDLIFEGPDMNQVTLRDLTFSRRPRAEL
ncbi:hypothetical protein TG4357_01763 [Thalassovita gelatinovora]|uniref:Uncharacterized protein n=1 Tax=Thalassovita gelatinovora TaxID=53501 RepID=A0A0P1FAP4_THAGE|nr:DUF6478 family protein [Thalassovita gelatinovora]QIZ80683.1 hypothetical protein HFZ77_09425 [Thalassovita gelatinovora]CUH65257.1 hypothetical protein TG4357_01763 [Thalassovita gelatinovora]SEQ88373.1 hypothetical protein SAMN04488043_11051 [Thalassovita gelatinovora]